MHTLRLLAVAALLLSCSSGSHAPGTTPPTGSNQLDVTIASVTLADDCGSGPTAMPPEPEEAARSMDEPASVAQSSKRSMSQAGDRACEQSSIQLRVSNTTAAGAKVAIEKVEILDESGTLIGELTPRAPSRWAADTYQAWDEQVAASEVLQVSYALSAPNLMRGASYTVRVTLAAGDDQRTLEKLTTLESEAWLPPGAVT